jgi:hypothetical protein
MRFVQPGSNQVVGLAPASMPIVGTLNTLLSGLSSPYTVILYNSDS